MSQKDLRRVRVVAAKLQRAELELADAILKAHDAGESYRDIAPWAGLPYSRVYRMATDRRRQRDSDP